MEQNKKGFNLKLAIGIGFAITVIGAFFYLRVKPKTAEKKDGDKPTISPEIPSKEAPPKNEKEAPPKNQKEADDLAMKIARKKGEEALPSFKWAMKQGYVSPTHDWIRALNAGGFDYLPTTGGAIGKKYLKAGGI